MATMQSSLLSTFFITILHLASAQQEEEEEPESPPPSSFHRIVIIHATLMGLVFVLLLPLGVFLIRLLPSKNKIWYHASLQLLSYTLALAAFSLGAWMATVSGAWTASNGHPILGTIIIALLLLQPVLGYVHHRIYMQRKEPTAWGAAHVWYGRLLILLAVINGGLGLQLSGNTVKGEIAYGVVAGVMFLLYLAVLGVAYLRKKGDKSLEGGKMVGGEKSRGIDEEVDRHGGGGAAANGAGSTRPLGRESAVRTEFEPVPMGYEPETSRLSVRNG